MIASSKTINLGEDNTQTSVHHPEESICYSYDLTNKKINFLLKGFRVLVIFSLITSFLSSKIDIITLWLCCCARFFFTYTIFSIVENSLVPHIIT